MRTIDVIEQMIVFRTLQGFIGGGMIPTVFASAFTIFPPEAHHHPADHRPCRDARADHRPDRRPSDGLFSWHWLFSSTSRRHRRHADLPVHDRFRRAGPQGCSTVSTGPACSRWRCFSALGCAGRRPSKNWFQENAIVYATFASAQRPAAFFFWRYISTNPIVDLRIRSGSFWAAAFSFVLGGIGLTGLTYIYPVYLGALNAATRR